MLVTTKLYETVERQNNGQQQGYSVRSWNDIKPMLIKMVKAKVCLIPYCLHHNSIKGALIVFEIGKRLTYISGGTLREEIDLKIGHFLHNEMIIYCIDKGYAFYDISVGGSVGVTRFKEGFGAKHLEFIGSRHWIFLSELLKLLGIFSRDLGTLPIFSVVQYYEPVR